MSLMIFTQELVGQHVITNHEHLWMRPCGDRNIGGDHVGTQEQETHPEREAAEENNPDKLSGIQNSKKTHAHCLGPAQYCHTRSPASFTSALGLL